jgi:hypothetical protein
LKVANRGRISEDDLKQVLDGVIKKESILCTDPHLSYVVYAKGEKLEHETIKVNAKQYEERGNTT